MHIEKAHYLSGWKGNILAVVAALILALIIFFVAQHDDALFADIAGGVDTPSFSEQGDIGVFIKDKNTLTVQSIKDISAVEDISILLIFDPEVISLEKENFVSRFPLAYASAGEGQGELILTISGDLKTGEKLFTLGGKNWDITKVVIGDTILHFADGSTESLSVETK